MSKYRQQLENWLAKLDVKADTVFDIGGEQGNVDSRVKSWDVNNYRVLDLPDCDLNQTCKPLLTMLDKDKADIVFCLEVMEYIYNPVNAMDIIAEALKPGGIAYVTFAFVYPHHNELEWDSLRYTEPGIRRLAKEARLKVRNIDYRIDASGKLEAFYRADGMRASAQYDHHNVTGFIVELEKTP